MLLKLIKQFVAWLRRVFKKPLVMTAIVSQNIEKATSTENIQRLPTKTAPSGTAHTASVQAGEQQSINAQLEIRIANILRRLTPFYTEFRGNNERHLLIKQKIAELLSIEEKEANEISDAITVLKAAHQTISKVDKEIRIKIVTEFVATLEKANIGLYPWLPLDRKNIMDGLLTEDLDAIRKVMYMIDLIQYSSQGKSGLNMEDLKTVVVLLGFGLQEEILRLYVLFERAALQATLDMQQVDRLHRRSHFPMRMSKIGEQLEKAYAIAAETLEAKLLRIKFKAGRQIVEQAFKEAPRLMGYQYLCAKEAHRAYSAADALDVSALLKLSPTVH